ncbi:low molecular weight phosphatase family protein [Bifidobacterium gallicum]|uniref:Low molecular weight phosphotyrosine protein phosphatase n=1 Tax=Bifidobacterium gallicum DSM 20093 = LMG 11596 TaxID=561180 RepID=D1NRT6_9BIFI|nr:low molecular weight phosphatase family protein [Bifidobacterium gallicum]EFA23925.1 low molecular weight phosphotyrosine protein phosphatase [Bifidobacterium gallicum DSM 20093 = LMG 11596]KFI59098.1 protein-tyrosine phosphatase [Bifidobacterium gallicum DSM 20093 = LMG 11596]
MMKVLFVCTGNICRSPMGEYLFPLFFNDSGLVMDSAGVQGLPASPIDPSSERLLQADGIDASAFRSKRLVPQIARSADLILCFSTHQRNEIVRQNPTVGRRTFTLNDFANICSYCAQHHLVSGDTLEQRLASVLEQAPMLRNTLPPASDIADPFRKDFAAFEQAHAEILQALGTIADALDVKGAHASV